MADTEVKSDEAKEDKKYMKANIAIIVGCILFVLFIISIIVAWKYVGVLASMGVLGIEIFIFAIYLNAVEGYFKNI
jgi:uncharacterized membrane protein